MEYKIFLSVGGLIEPGGVKRLNIFLFWSNIFRSISRVQNFPILYFQPQKISPPPQHRSPLTAPPNFLNFFQVAQMRWLDLFAEPESWFHYFWLIWKLVLIDPKTLNFDLNRFYGTRNFLRVKFWSDVLLELQLKEKTESKVSIPDSQA